MRVINCLLIFVLCNLFAISINAHSVPYGYSIPINTVNQLNQPLLTVPINAGLVPVRVDISNSTNGLNRPFSMYLSTDRGFLYISDMSSNVITTMNLHSGILTNLTQPILCTPLDIDFDGTNNIILTSEGCLQKDEGFISVDMKKGWGTRLPFKQAPYTIPSIPYGIAIDRQSELIKIYITDWELKTLSIYDQLYGTLTPILPIGFYTLPVNLVLHYMNNNSNSEIIAAVLDNSGFSSQQPMITIWFTQINANISKSYIIPLTAYPELSGNGAGLALSNDANTAYITSLSGGVYSINLSELSIIRLDSADGTLIGTTDVILDSIGNLYLTDADSAYHPGKPLSRPGAVFYLKLNNNNN